MSPGRNAPAPRLVFWESTRRCNLNCIHCRRGRDDPEPELSTAEAKRLVDSAASLGRAIFVFSGGEPLLRGDWEELSRYAVGLGLPTALATNGTLIDGGLAERIARAFFSRVAVSLDGADAVTHDPFRGCPGAFERSLAGMRMLRSAGVPLQLNSTIAKHNADQLDRLYELAGAIGAVALHLFLLVPVGCGLEMAPDYQLPPQRYERVLEWICHRQEEGGLELKATCAPQYVRVADRRGLPPGGAQSRGCLAGTGIVFVSATGEVYPCGYLPVRCGSVRENSLAEIWRTSEVFAALRDPGRLRGRCGRCEYKARCGGCRARAYAAGGDYLQEDPSCLYEPPA